MHIYSRIIEDQIKKALEDKNHNIILVLGPRQAGKTTLIKKILSEIKSEIIEFSGDDIFTQSTFANHSLENLKQAVGEADLLFIDEAQRIPNIGLSLKLLHDHTDLRIIVSGSSSFDLMDKLSEPLTGRTNTFYLYPFSYSEIESRYRNRIWGSALEEMLIYGMYPKVHTIEQISNKIKYLSDLLSNNLYKDILTFDEIKKPQKVLDLLKLLAHQIGSEVKISEIAQQISLSQRAVEKYLTILEKMFVIYNLRGFSRNLRKEISKTSKYYFYDLGLRNALIRSFNPLDLRADAGRLFENWFIMERVKMMSYKGFFANHYFWRTYDQREIDLIEERSGKLWGFECKTKGSISRKTVVEWHNAYPKAKITLVNLETARKYLL